MILLHVSSPDIDLLHVIAESLLKEKLVADVRIDTIRRLTLDNGSLKEIPRFLLACKTKALLFNPIVEHIRSSITGELPEIYALPLVSVERTQEEIIRSRTRAI